MTLTLEAFLRSKLCIIFGGQSNAVKAQCHTVNRKVQKEPQAEVAANP